METKGTIITGGEPSRYQAIFEFELVHVYIKCHAKFCFLTGGVVWRPSTSCKT